MYDTYLCSNALEAAAAAGVAVHSDLGVSIVIDFPAVYS